MAKLFCSLRVCVGLFMPIRYHYVGRMCICTSPICVAQKLRSMETPPSQSAAHIERHKTQPSFCAMRKDVARVNCEQTDIKRHPSRTWRHCNIIITDIMILLLAVYILCDLSPHVVNTPLVCRCAGKRCSERCSVKLYSIPRLETLQTLSCVRLLTGFAVT